MLLFFFRFLLFVINFQFIDSEKWEMEQLTVIPSSILTLLSKAVIKCSIWPSNVPRTSITAKILFIPKFNLDFSEVSLPKIHLKKENRSSI